MNLRRLKWGFLGLLVLLFVFVEFARYQVDPYLGTWRGRLAMDLVILVASLFFFGLVFDLMSRLQRSLEHRNEELLGLHHAALDIHANLSLDVVLQKVVDRARELLDVRFGALSVLHDDGGIVRFIVSGVSPEERERIGDPPVGRGLLGVTLREGERLRLADIRDDPRSAGFPANHPEMRSLLAVPINFKGSTRGNLYLADRQGRAFTEEEEESLVRFATTAALAIDNADLHARLRSLDVARERARIANEMHDGLAQVLAYVNIKAQAVREHLARDRTDQAQAQLEQLAAAAREVHTDVREGILALRSVTGPGRPLAVALEEFLGAWRVQSGVRATLAAEPDLDLPMGVQLQLLRIVQEALTNVRKHADADEVRVSLEVEGGSLVASVEDSGRGFDIVAAQALDPPRFGLEIMRERSESIGARLRVDSEPGRGTRVTITLPLPK